MDPNETLRRMLETKDRHEAQELGEALAEWLRRGGFAPTVPDGAKYWPGRGTEFSLLDPEARHYEGTPGQFDRWRLVRWDGKGEALEVWNLVA